jgi:glucosamine kinase
MNALGIDAGGSSTKWAVVNAAGERLASGRVAAFGGHLFDDASRRAALEVMKTLNDLVQPFAPRVAVAGVTGLARESTLARWVRSALRERLGLKHCVVVSDMDLAYRAHFAPGEGMLVYAGTGSIAYHVTSTLEARRSGGRGYLIDDAGGGFWIGRQALRFVVRQMDTGRLGHDPLTLEVLKQLGTSTWDDMREFVYGGGRTAVASLAPAVGRAEARGSPEARSILEHAGLELRDLAARLETQVGRLPITLAGGALLVSPRIAEAARDGGLEFTASAVDIALEAARLASTRAVV